MKLLYQAWYANSLSDFGLAALVLAALLLCLAALRHGGRRVLCALAGDTAATSIALKVLAATRLWLLSPLATYGAASALELPPKLDHGIELMAAVALMLQSALWINCLLKLWLARSIEQRRAVDSEGATVLSLLAFAARLVVWTLTLLLILNHLNFNITALVTGLGIGGVAVALAVQNVLGDLFASLSIILDQPFVLGDFIIVGDCLGSVEHIGLKTTRLRSLGGELIVFSNADLLKSRIRNYKRMFERRVVFTLGLAYDSSEEQLRQLAEALRRIVEAQRSVRFERAHFKEFGEQALSFEVAYYVLSADYTLYMDIQQAINLAIFRYVRQERMAFALPWPSLRLQDKASSPANPQSPKETSWLEETTG